MSQIPGWKSKKHAPLGRCVYCGATDALSDEHIIPFGLLPRGGDWFLPDASCPTCADITKRFEGFCQRAMLGNLRARLNLKSRRKRKQTVPMRFADETGATNESVIPAIEAPMVCIGFNWETAGLLRGLPPSDNFHGRVVARYAVGEVEKLETQASRKLHLGAINQLAFARMLAKIAHCYIAAVYGTDSFRPMLRDLILGSDQNAPYLVGGDGSGVPLVEQPNVLHDIYRQDCLNLAVGKPLVLVSIRLFAFMGMPRYQIVVGEKLK